MRIMTPNKMPFNIHRFKKRVERIELSSLAWKAKVLPLNYTRECFLNK